MKAMIKEAVKAEQQNESKVLLLKDGKSLPAGFFSGEELNYIRKKIQDKKNTLVINQYHRTVCIHVVDRRKDGHLLLESCRKAGEQIAAALNRHKVENVRLVDVNGLPEYTLALAEGMALGNYQFLKYKSDEKKEKETNSLQAIAIESGKIRDDKINRMNVVVDAVCRARDLVNEPLSHLTATQLSEAFLKMGKEAGFRTEIFDKAKIKSLKMGGLLAVNRGSQQPPTFTVMEWKPRQPKNKKPYVIIGKGVVYDTGGLSLKPTASAMDYMKSDMAGAAAVGCTMYAIAKLKLPVHVVALVPATDNRPSEDAYVPGDVITMMSGLTIEVLNTDAEGRMILADALHYAKKYDPELVMDFATLTGAAAVAIGPYGIVCMGTAKDQVKEKLKRSGMNVYERLVEFPIWEEYNDLLKSDIADMKNVGGPVGGAISAGKFLQRFTDYPWMHFDIAGPSFLHSTSSYRGKNGSGVGVRLMFDFFSHI